MSFNSSDDDGQQRFALGFLTILIALVVSTVVGVVVYQRGMARAPAAAPVLAGTDAAPVAAAAPGVVVTEEASVVVEGGVVKFYFASGSAALAPGAAEALADVARGAGEQGRTALVSGYHDATGDAALNAELAKQRAMAVRDALLELGVPAERVELRKPEVTQADGDNAEARRVEVVLAP